MVDTTGRCIGRIVVGLITSSLILIASAKADNRLLKEGVELNAQALFLETKVPGLIIGVVRNGESVVLGFGEISNGSKKEPNGNTIMRVGSLTKSFTGQVLASLAAQGAVRMTDRLQDHIGWDVRIPNREGRDIRLIDLATHTSGLPREAQREEGPPNDPFSTLTSETYIQNLRANPLVFAPGTAALYSNFAFDLLAQALANAAHEPYETLLKQEVLDPAGLKDTGLHLRDGDAGRLFQGHNFDGTPLPNVETTPVMAGASAIYSTPNDVLRWLAWHMDGAAVDRAEVRLLDHASYVQRDGLKSVLGLDESGRMSAISLGWIVMAPEGDRPLILQKAGGLQGIFSYTAFAPTRGIGVFIAISKFDFGAASLMAKVANDLIEQLAPR